MGVGSCATVPTAMLHSLGRMTPLLPVQIHLRVSSSCYFSKKKKTVDGPPLVARTQEVDVTAQLQAGARMLQGQAHMKGGTLHLCHTCELLPLFFPLHLGSLPNKFTACDLFDGGALVDYLKKVKSFMDANPNEVITLVLTNPESVSIRDQWIPAFDSSGLSPLIFTPSTRPTRRADWPTLGSLIDSGKKLVVFLDNGADASFPQLQPEFDSVSTVFFWQRVI